MPPQTSRMNRRTLLLTGLAAAAPTHAQPATKIALGYTAVTDFASAFVAVEEGYFSKRGLDVQPQFIPINSTIPAALQAGSLQVGGPTPSVFLQAVDGGLAHVVVAGGGATAKSTLGFGLVARTGSGIKTAQDCVGRTIGVPGLGAFLHVTFRAWLRFSAVDYKKVSFVEAAFPQHADLLRGGSVDGVVSAEPFMTRLAASGNAYVASYYSSFMPDGVPTIVYAARRDWAAAHTAQVSAFRDALVEAAAWMGQPANEARLRQHIGKYIKLPPEVLAKMIISPPLPIVPARGLDYWVDMMKDQEMLTGTPNTAKLLQP